MPIKDYFTPKSLIYTGKHDNIETKIKHFYYEDNLKVTEDFDKRDQKSYIQVVGLSNVEKIEALKAIYPVDTLVLEDVFNVHQRVKIEDKKKYIFSVFHVLYEQAGTIYEDYLSMLLFDNTLISFHEKEPLYLDALYPLLESNSELKTRGIDYLYYLILDIITDKHLGVIEASSILLEAFEADILESKKVNQEDFYQIRKSLLRLKSVTAPLYNELDKVISSNKLLFKSEHDIYFDDLKDHLNRLSDNLGEQREQMRHLLDLHINNQSNQMNQIMKTLTLFSAIFIPLSFLTGFFGMNFTNFDALRYEHAVIIFICGSLALVLGMIYLFKRMRYFK